MLLALVKIKIDLNSLKKDRYFLLFINIFPIILIFLTSIISGAKIRTVDDTLFIFRCFIDSTLQGKYQ